MADITSIIEDPPESESITNLGPEATSSTSPEKESQIIHGYGPEENRPKSLSEEPEKISSMLFPKEQVEQPSTENNIKDLTDIPEKIDTLITTHKPTGEADEIENKFITNVQNEQVERIF